MNQKPQEIALSSSLAKYSNLQDEEALIPSSYSSIITQDTANPSINNQRYFGNSKVFWFKNGEPLCSLGPHWIFFVFAWLGLEIGGILFYIHTYNYLSEVAKILLVVLIIWQGFIFLLTALKNPGIVSAQNPNDPELLKLTDQPHFCVKCKIIKEKDTVHCFDCKVCIRGFDHHCPWTGKCIGAGNLYPFYAFLISTTFYMFCFVYQTIQRLPPK